MVMRPASLPETSFACTQSILNPWDGNWILTTVITSYSIHYTKLYEKSIAYESKVKPFLNEIRTHIDKLELVVDNELWPLPKYRELLFTR